MGKMRNNLYKNNTVMNLKVYKNLSNLPDIAQISSIDPNFKVSTNPSNLSSFVKVK